MRKRVLRAIATRKVGLLAIGTSVAVILGIVALVISIANMSSVSDVTAKVLSLTTEVSSLTTEVSSITVEVSDVTGEVHKITAERAREKHPNERAYSGIGAWVYCGKKAYPATVSLSLLAREGETKSPVRVDFRVHEYPSNSFPEGCLLNGGADVIFSDLVSHVSK